MNLSSSGTANYLLGAAREVLVRLYFERGNLPLEFSQLRLALEAHGITAYTPHHWGIFSATLKASGLFESTGREIAVAASRNSATNQAWKLSPDGWAYARLLAERRGWVQTKTEHREQVSLV